MKIIGGRSYQGPFHQMKSTPSPNRTCTAIDGSFVLPVYRTYAKERRTYTIALRTWTKNDVQSHAREPYSDERLSVLAREPSGPTREKSVVARKSAVLTRNFSRTCARDGFQAFRGLRTKRPSKWEVSKYVSHLDSISLPTTTYEGALND